MPKRSAQIVEEFRRGTPLREIDPSILDINSRGGQQRKSAEIKRRLENADESVWRKEGGKQLELDFETV